MNDEILKFISEEVTRQGHVGKDHGVRCGFMETAWEHAQLRRDAGVLLPTVADLLNVARKVEPGVNSIGFRRIQVQMGYTEFGADWNEVPRLIEQLWGFLPEVKLVRKRNASVYLTLDDFYIEFEKIHPFEDGNGRTGKIIYNWILGTLDDPVLVADYFGGGVP